MESKYKINIPEPCSEEWDKMTATDNGKFCSSCAKNVVDFTAMMPDEIQYYFQQHSNICGRFKKSQLDSLIIQIPNRVLYTQTQYRKMFLLALFITMGTTLFSCADKNGNKLKIDKVEIVADSVETENIILGMRLPPKKDTNNRLQNKIPPAPTTSKDQVKFVKPKTMQCVEKRNEKTQTATNNKIVQEEEIYNGGIEFYLDPEYKGGMEKFKEYVQQNYTFPKKAKSLNGVVTATFVIEKDGSLSNFKFLKDIGEDTRTSLVRVLEKSEKWTPGSQNGKLTRSQFKISLIIKTDTLKMSFFKNRINQRIDSIIIKH